MTENFSHEFYHKFSEAFCNYEAGEWSVAKRKLQDLQPPEPCQDEDIVARLSAKAARLKEATAKGSKETKKAGGATVVPGVKSSVVKKMTSVRGKKSGGENLDGPSQSLLEFMKSYNFQAPADWRGYRYLKDV